MNCGGVLEGSSLVLLLFGALVSIVVVGSVADDSPTDTDVATTADDIPAETATAADDFLVRLFCFFRADCFPPFPFPPLLLLLLPLSATARVADELIVRPPLEVTIRAVFRLPLPLDCFCSVADGDAPPPLLSLLLLAPFSADCIPGRDVSVDDD